MTFDTLFGDFDKPVWALNKTNDVVSSLELKNPSLDLEEKRDFTNCFRLDILFNSDWNYFMFFQFFFHGLEN